MNAPTESGTVPVDDVIVSVVPGPENIEIQDQIADGISALSRALVAEPASVMQKLADTAMRLTQAQSCGVSLLDERGGQFRWVVTGGEFQRYVRGTMPRDFSPCGTVLDRGEALVMLDPVRHYPAIAQLSPPVRAVMLVPLSENDRLIGTLWVVKHSDEEPFTAADLAAAKALAGFASSVFQAASLITKLRLEEQNTGRLLSQSETARRLLETGFQQAPGFVAFLRGREHVFELVNEAYMRLVGQRELVGKRVFDALPETRAQGFEELLDRVYASGQAHVGRDVKIDLTDEKGEHHARYVDFVYQPLFDDGGQVAGIFVQGNDVTTQHHALCQLQQAIEVKENFLTLLSHELKNPLSSVRMAASLMRHTSGKDDPRQVRAVEILNNQTSVLARLVDDLVDVETVRTGKLTLDVEPVSLQDVVQMAVESMQMYIGLRGHRLDVILGDDPIFVKGDSVRLCQVFTNLLSNAAKYSPEGSVIVLSVRSRADETVVIDVRDDGIGITKEFLPRIFDMYVQAPKPGVFHRGGLGLGLALVKQLVEMHDGTIEATSDGLGRGTCFTITLPSGADFTST